MAALTRIGSGSGCERCGTLLGLGHARRSDDGNSCQVSPGGGVGIRVERRASRLGQVANEPEEGRKEWAKANSAHKEKLRF